MARQEWPAEPTAEQCSANARLPDWNGWRAHACWYPQMGGYVGKCVVCVAEPGGCFEAFVWHDGEFPFDGEDAYGHGPVRHLHRCVSGQFEEFGRVVRALQEGKDPRKDETDELLDAARDVLETCDRGGLLCDSLSRLRKAVEEEEDT